MSRSLWSLMPDRAQRAKARIGGFYRPRQQRLAAFLLDRRINTAEEVPCEQLTRSDPDQRHYVASGWFFLRRGLLGHKVGPADVFVDFGSGKGRLVYQAARQPFGRVVGIELHEQLNEIARRNIETNRHRLRCRNVELITGDITTTPVPDDMTVAYLFNPVVGESFERLLGNIVASLDRRDRRLRLIYANAVENRAVERTGRFVLIRGSRGLRPDRDPSVHVYESRPRPR